MINDLVEFVLLNRTSRVFIGWSKEDLQRAFYLAWQQQTLAYSIDALDNKVNGVCLASKNIEDKIITALEVLILPGAKGVLKSFISFYSTLYPPQQGWTLKRCKRKLWKHYLVNTEALCRRILKNN